jgi:serine/threonine protein kinase
LLLYYRWALQTLSALQFLHSHFVYLRDFSCDSIWIREDFSAAITGFIQATFPGAELMGGEDFPRPGGGGIDFSDFEAEYDQEGFQIYGTPRSDICDWATAIWELMTNDHTASPPQRPGGIYSIVWPEDPKGWPEEWDYKEDERRVREKKFCQLEEARLGPILVKAWSGDYKNVSEVICDVRAVLRKKGIEVIGEDEVLPGDTMPWGDMFTIVPPSGEHPYRTEIRLRERRGLDSMSRMAILPEVEQE